CGSTGKPIVSWTIPRGTLVGMIMILRSAVKHVHYVTASGGAGGSAGRPGAGGSCGAAAGVGLGLVSGAVVVGTNVVARSDSSWRTSCEARSSVSWGWSWV